jgi:hypothetical protein
LEEVDEEEEVEDGAFTSCCELLDDGGGAAADERVRLCRAGKSSHSSALLVSTTGKEVD